MKKNLNLNNRLANDNIETRDTLFSSMQNF